MGGRADFANGTVKDKIAGAKNIGDAVKKYGEDSPIPVVLHLDHGRDMESVKAAIAGRLHLRHDRRARRFPSRRTSSSPARS